MKIIDRPDYKIVILESDDDSLGDLLETNDMDKLIFVSMEGYKADTLPIERFLVKNHTSPFKNHLMWEGFFHPKEQDAYIVNRCNLFWETNNQMIIEDYVYEEHEPFYDYSK